MCIYVYIYIYTHIYVYIYIYMYIYYAIYEISTTNIVSVNTLLDKKYFQFKFIIVY